MTKENMAPETISVSLNGKQTELTMYFGLLHELLGIVRDLTAVGMVAIDNDLRSQVLNAVLAERDDDGNIIVPVNMKKLKVSAADVQVICNWVAGHTLDFFLVGIEKAVETQQRLLTVTATP